MSKKQLAHEELLQMVQLAKEAAKSAAFAADLALKAVPLAEQLAASLALFSCGWCTGMDFGAFVKDWNERVETFERGRDQKFSTTKKIKMFLSVIQIDGKGLAKCTTFQKIVNNLRTKETKGAKGNLSLEKIQNALIRTAPKPTPPTAAQTPEQSKPPTAAQTPPHYQHRHRDPSCHSHRGPL
jgi:hypothetical protein